MGCIIIVAFEASAFQLPQWLLLQAGGHQLVGSTTSMAALSIPQYMEEGQDGVYNSSSLHEGSREGVNIHLSFSVVDITLSTVETLKNRCREEEVLGGGWGAGAQC